MQSHILKTVDYTSPRAVMASTPSDCLVRTPSAHDTKSPQDAPSPLMVDLKRKTAVERAHLFVSGGHQELMKSMNKAERKCVIKIGTAVFNLKPADR